MSSAARSANVCQFGVQLFATNAVDDDQVFMWAILFARDNGGHFKIIL
jgi:hypothetical protein